MRARLSLALIGLVALVAAACSSTSTPSADAPATVADGVSLWLPVQVLIVDDEDGARDSARTVEEIERIFDRVGEIWAQAGIAFDLVTVERLALPGGALDALANSDAPGFLAQLPEETLGTLTGSLTGFYARDIGPANGFTVLGTPVFFVRDDPTVHDERVSAHEIGHILGLQHVPPVERLMAEGVNGTALVDEEIATARSVAERVLDLLDAPP